MQLKDKIVVVTGGANGIGRALCRIFAAQGASGIVVADRDEEGAKQVATEIGGLAVVADVSCEKDMQQLVAFATSSFGPIDLFCSNAGLGYEGGIDSPDADWMRLWNVNVMGHIYASRAVLPSMLARGQGYLLQTASAAGLLSQIGSAPYTVTKHAAVAFAEWLSITYGHAGIRVSCLCPQGVKTQMLMSADDGIASFLIPEALEPETVAECVIAGLAEERFLILPHPKVATYFQNKANDYERWLRGMRRWQEKLSEQLPKKTS